MRLVRAAGAALLVTAALAAPALAGFPNVDLVVSKSDAPDPVAAGSNLTYTITVQNDGPQSANLVALSDTLPAGTTFVSLTGPAGWTLTRPPVGGTGTVMATRATLSVADGAQAFSLVLNLDSGLPPGTLTNTATVVSEFPDADPSDNSATATTTVAGAATPAPTPQASLADAAMPPSTGSQQLAILGFAVLLVGVLGASAVLAVRRART